MNFEGLNEMSLEINPMVEVLDNWLVRSGFTAEDIMNVYFSTENAPMFINSNYEVLDMIYAKKNGQSIISLEEVAEYCAEIVKDFN